MLSWETLEFFLTIEMIQLFPFLPEFAASSSLRWENCSGVSVLYFDSGCEVYSNSFIPSPEMTETTGFFSFYKIPIVCW